MLQACVNTPIMHCVRPDQNVLEGVVEIMEEVLGRPVDSVEDSFGYLGGRSMSLMVLLARVKRRFGVAVLPSEFLARPTAAALAGLVGDAGRGRAG